MKVGLSDEEVVVRCLGGDTDAFGVVVRRYQARFLRLAAGALGDRAAAQDIVQDTFIRVYTRLHRYRPGTQFSAWIYTVFSRQLKDALRRRKRQSGFFERLTAFYRDEQKLTEGPEETPPDVGWIKPALSRLSEKQRLCILLRDIERLDTTEVAKQLGTSETTVRVHLMRGRRKLREIYEREIASK